MYHADYVAEKTTGISDIRCPEGGTCARREFELERTSVMNRWLLIGSMACLLVASTGCRMGGGGCGGGACSSGTCNESYGDCGDGGTCNGGTCNGGTCNGHGCGKGILGRMCGMCFMSNGGCNECGDKACGGGCGLGGCNGRLGCQAGPLGWQQGGLDYSSHLQPGLIGHHAPAALNNRPFTPGPPSTQVAYPYYTHKGPRDFLLDNPPTIGR